MLNTREVAEEFNKETHRLIGEVQLQRYAAFIERFIDSVSVFENKLNSKRTIKAKPITVEIIPRENVTLLQLVHSDNRLLSRILISVASICDEINKLVVECNEFCDQFVNFGEVEEIKANEISRLSKLFEALQRVQLFTHRSQQVITLLLRQLSAILGKGFYTGSSSSSFPEPLQCLAELLVSIMTLDLLLNSTGIKNYWVMYRRLVRSFSHGASQYNIKQENMKALDKKLLEIETELISGNILRNTIEKALDESTIVASKNCNLANEVHLQIQQLLGELEKDDENIFLMQLWLRVNVLFVLHYNLTSNVEKKVLKRLLEINKKLSVCPISGNTLWYPENFLLNQIPVISKSIDLKSIATSRAAQVNNRSQNLVKEAHSVCTQACYWIIELERVTKQDMNHFKTKHLQETCQLLMDGIKLVKKVSGCIKWFINLYADEGRPMTKSISVTLCKFVEVLKCFQFVIHKNILPLSYVIVLITQQLTHKALGMLGAIKKSFTQERNYKEQQLDVLSAVVVAERALKGPNTSERILVAKLALSASGLQNDVLDTTRATIDRLELLCNLVKLFNRLSNCSFLYWHQVLFPVYFLKLLLATVSDCQRISDPIVQLMEMHIKSNLLAPLNQCVETNLRLQTHLHLQLPPCDPFQNILPKNFKSMFPVIFGHNFLDIKNEVEHYLSTMFYNLTTVVLHDWRTYGEMRQLAVLQYGLHTIEDSLPVQTLEQGLDVLEIMRNINIFVGKYLYNLNNQVFVEDWSTNKHLNTINISHVANSIRTHGIGIMNTTVNFTYQFLQNKFYIFSQFMFDEHIKSRLLKDLRYFSEHKTDLNQLYPYARAEKFNFGIRKLGLNETGLTYLDLFRKLITQIGNAMGYVRLIRSGGKRCVADATCFLPQLKAIDELNSTIDSADLTDLTKHAANCLKRDINNLVDNFEEATEYFKLLINVFSPTFRDPQNIHLRNFYMIVPPLTINFIEHSLTCKERLNKKNHEGAAFTDDGFAMGLAYIIELLGQGSQLNSLHWFQSVQSKQTQDRHDLELQRSKSSREDVKLQQTLSLTEKRIMAVEKEFKLLYYSFNSARIFFQM